MLRDIRDHIAKSPTLDPNKFPRVGYRRYPWMVLDKNGKPVIEKGKRVRFTNPGEEDEFYKTHNEADYPRLRDPEDTRSELDRLREENRRLKEAGRANDPDRPDTAPVTGKEPGEKGDNTSAPVDAGQVQKEAAQRAGGGGITDLAKGAGAGQKAGPKPGSKLG